MFGGNEIQSFLLEENSFSYLKENEPSRDNILTRRLANEFECYQSGEMIT